MRNRNNLVWEIWCEIVTLASGERCNVSDQKIQLLKIWEVLQLKFELTVNGLGKLSNGKNSYRVFGNEGYTESGSNLIDFYPEIL